MNAQPSPIVQEPAATHTASVIWLHGLGADGNDFAPVHPLLRSVNRHTRFVFPNAPHIPVSINQGMVMPAWYDIGMGAEGTLVSDEAGIRASAGALAGWIAAEHGDGIAYERIVVAGFSQGGAIALHTALRYPHGLAGLLALSTYLPLAEQLPGEREPANQDIPLLMAHGREDPMIPIQRAEQSRDFLGSLGYRVEWHAYPMEHAVSPQEIADIDAWLGRVIP